MRKNVPTGTQWGENYGYSRAVRCGSWIAVAGTTAPGDTAYSQTMSAFGKIEEALQALGAALEDVIRVRMFVVGLPEHGDEAARAHGEVFRHIRPALTAVGVMSLFSPELLVEVEVDAVVPE